MKTSRFPKSLNYKKGDVFLNKANPKLAFEYNFYDPDLGVVHGKLYNLRKKKDAGLFRIYSPEELNSEFVKVEKSDIINVKASEKQRIPDRFDNLID